MEREKLEKEKAEKERLEREKLEREKAEKERLEREKQGIPAKINLHNLIKNSGTKMKNTTNYG